MPTKTGNLLTIKDLKSYDKNLLKEVTISNRIEAMLEDQNLDPTHLSAKFDVGGDGRRTHVFHASTIGLDTGTSLCGKYPMGCARQLYYSYTHADSEEAIDPRLRRIFDTGTVLHSMLQMYMAECARRNAPNEEFQAEVDIDPDHNEIADALDISGHMDGLYTIAVPHGKIRFGIEIKTINDSGYKNTRGPHPKHIIQGTIYQACLDLPVMLFLYYNKNDSSMAEFIQIFDPSKWEAIKEKINYIREHVLNKTVPDRETSMSCTYCKYKGVCKPPKKIRGSAVGRMFQTKG